MQKSTQLTPVAGLLGNGLTTHGGIATLTEKQYTTVGLYDELTKEIAILESKLETKGALTPEELTKLALLRTRHKVAATAIAEKRDASFACEHTAGETHPIPLARLVSQPDTRFCIPHLPPASKGFSRGRQRHRRS